MADLKITQLDAVSSPDDADLIEAVQDVATTPVNKKMTWTQVKAFFKTYFDTLYDALGSASTVQGNLDTHEADTANPHEVTYTQVGADQVGSASTVQGNLDTHEADTTAHGATGANVGTTNTQTLTNKRVTPRVGAVASSGTPTIDTDAVDAFSITALAVAITSFTANLSGTPTNFQKLIIRIKDDGTGRSIAWGASFEAKGVALPTTTTASKVLSVGFLYDSVTSKWGCVASVEEA